MRFLGAFYLTFHRRIMTIGDCDRTLEETTMATIQEMMELAERIGLQGQEVAHFIRVQQERAMQRGKESSERRSRKAKNL